MLAEESGGSQTLSNAYQIREAHLSDAAAVVALTGILDDLHTEHAPYQFCGSSAEPRSEQFVLDLIEASDAAIFVAEVGTRVVGHAVVKLDVMPDRPPLIPRRYAQIHDLVVAEGMRRRGIGQALVLAAERWARARGVDSIELTVWEFNEAARRLYDKLEFTTQYRRLRRQLPGAD